MESSLRAMEGIVLGMGLTRIILVTAVALLNLSSLLRHRPACLHSLVNEAVLLCNVVYLCSWLPFLLYSFFNGRWVILDDHSYCHMQNFVTNTISMVFLGLLTLLVMEHTRMRILRDASILTPKKSAAMVLAMWILPQLLYDFATILGGQPRCRTSLFRFLDDIMPFSEGGEAAPRHKYRIGFMICEQVLTKEAVVEHIWKYVMVVLPFFALVLVCGVMRVFWGCARRTQPLSVSAGDVVGHEDRLMRSILKASSGCKHYQNQRYMCTDAVGLVLIVNLVWQLVLRPCFIYMLWVHPTLGSAQLYGYMDFGSHLVLTISTVFVPLSSAVNSGNPRDEEKVFLMKVTDFEDDAKDYQKHKY